MKKKWKIAIALLLLIVILILAGLISWLLPGLRTSWTIRQATRGEIWSLGGNAPSFEVPSGVIPWVFFEKGQCLCAHFFEVRFYDKKRELLLRAEYCNHCFDVKEIKGEKVDWNLRIDPKFYQFLEQQQQKVGSGQSGKKGKDRNKKGKDKP